MKFCYAGHIRNSRMTVTNILLTSRFFSVKTLLVIISQQFLLHFTTVQYIVWNFFLGHHKVPKNSIFPCKYHSNNALF